MIYSSDDFFEEGRALFDSQEFERALHSARVGLRRFPGDFDLRLLEAEALAQLGHYSIASEVLNELIEREPDDVDVLIALAEVAERQGKASVSIRLAREVLVKEEFDEHDAFRLAEIFDRHGDPSEVVRCCALAVRRSAVMAEAWFLMGCALARSDRLRAAEFCCLRVVSLRSDFFIVRTMLGWIYFQAGVFDKARDAWASVPMDQQQDVVALARWRSLLSSDDPRRRLIRERWAKLRGDARKDSRPWMFY